jgi:hypothetical protein
MIKQKTVSMSIDDYELWKKLKKAGLTFQSFPQFVKAAFNDKVTKMRLENPEIFARLNHNNYRKAGA